MTEYINTLDEAKHVCKEWCMDYVVQTPEGYVLVDANYSSGSDEGAEEVAAYIYDMPVNRCFMVYDNSNNY